MWILKKYFKNSKLQGYLNILFEVLFNILFHELLLLKELIVRSRNSSDYPNYEHDQALP